MNLLSSLLFVLMLNIILVVSQKEQSNSQIIKDILRNYDRNQPPRTDRGTEVRVGIYVNSFHSIDAQAMDYTVNGYFRQAWKDPRLAFTPSDRTKKSITLDENAMKSIWIPDTFFRNDKKSTFHYVTVPNKLLRINATGHVWYVTKITAKLSCPMKLQKFPFDTQSCPLMIESFSHTMDTLYFSWLDSPVDVDGGVRLPAFTLKDVIRNDCSQNYTAGEFPCLEMDFVLKRDAGYFISQVFFPSIIIVILSWIAFWIKADDVTPRVLIGFMTVLIICAQGHAARAALPHVSYLTAIDLWLSMCLIFAFAPLIESAVVNFISSQETKTDEKEAEGSKGGIPKGKELARKIDKLARLVFPVVFLVFNIIYWLIYNV